MMKFDTCIQCRVNLIAKRSFCPSVVRLWKRKKVIKYSLVRGIHSTNISQTLFKGFNSLVPTLRNGSCTKQILQPYEASRISALTLLHATKSNSIGPPETKKLYV